MAFVPLIATVVLAPVLSFAIVQFVLLPGLKKQLAVPIDPKAAQAAAAAPEEKSDASADSKGKEGKDAKGGNADAKSYEFANVVVNLSGTMGTRYLKTSFVITGVKPDTIKAIFEENKAKLTDVTLGVLSSLSLSDLEEPGAKNVLREKLVTAYNQALGSRVAEQIYFSDFVVQ